ncbi:MAG: PIN domain-containing protein [Candidatus Micrarchaeota archaeon]
MKAVVDTNVLLTAFWKGSVFNRIAPLPHLTLYAPAHAMVEICKHKETIARKTGVDGALFDEEVDRLTGRIRFFEVKEYRSSLQAAARCLKELPEGERTAALEDIDFLALAHARRCALWSNDALLKRQKAVVVLDTRELVLLLEP